MKKNAMIKKGWKVLLAGLCINLTLGVLYSWSVIQKALVQDWNWSNSDASLPYTVAILTWAIALIFAGRLQDKIGPRKVVTMGAIFTGLGLILSGLTSSVLLLTIAFGVLAGAGIGFAYSAVTPPALKWFHPSKKGMVTGIVVSGMGLASLYIAPITSFLLETYGVSTTFIVLGIFILVVATPVAQLLTNPPEGYVPPAPKNVSNATTTNTPTTSNFEWKEMMKTKQFYLLWIMFALSSSAGLMIIGNIATIANLQANLEAGFYLVGLLALFNAVGRLGAGILSDKIGRVPTMMIIFALQGVNMALFATYSTSFTIAIGAAIAGIGYGSLLSLFPSTAADFYGMKNFGANYGVLYTAWGISGLIGPIIAGFVVDSTGSYDLAYLISAILLVVALGLAIITKPVQETVEAKSSAALETGN